MSDYTIENFKSDVQELIEKNQLTEAYDYITENAQYVNVDVSVMAMSLNYAAKNGKSQVFTDFLASI